MATKIGEDHLIRILSSGDAASNEIFYHNENTKPCLANFHKKYQTECKNANGAVNKDHIDWLKSSALDKVYFYIYETEIQTPSSFFKVKDLENMYIDLLQCHNIIISSHVSCFSEDLITRYEALEKIKVKKQVIIYFKIAAENLFNDALSAPSSFLRSMYQQNY